MSSSAAGWAPEPRQTFSRGFRLKIQTGSQSLSSILHLAPARKAGAFFWWYAEPSHAVGGSNHTVRPIVLLAMSSRLARSAGLIGIATMASRVLGVAREVVLAALFGAAGGVEMDAFNVAFRDPESAARSVRRRRDDRRIRARRLRVRSRDEGRDAAWRLGNLVIDALLVITGSLVILGVVFAAPITSLIAPRFAATPGKLELTTTLTRVMLPSSPPSLLRSR